LGWGCGLQVLCKIPDIHAVIDRAVAANKNVSTNKPRLPAAPVISGDLVTTNPSYHGLVSLGTA